MTQVDPLMGQVTLISPPIDVASEASAAGGSAVRFDLPTIAASAGALDAGGLSTLKDSLPPGAQVIYPAIAPGSLGGSAVNLGLAPSVISPILQKGYGIPASGPGGASELAQRHAGAASAAKGPGAGSKPLSGSIVPKGSPIGKSAGILPSASADPAGALGKAGAGQAQRGGPLDFLGVPVRLAPSLGGTSRLNEEVEARRPAVDPGGGSVKPQKFNALREKLFPGAQSVTAEPDKSAWNRAAPALGLRDAHPATVLSPDARYKPPTASQSRPQIGGAHPAAGSTPAGHPEPFTPAHEMALAAPDGKAGATHSGGTGASLAISASHPSPPRHPSLPSMMPPGGHTFPGVGSEAPVGGSPAANDHSGSSRGTLLSPAIPPIFPSGAPAHPEITGSVPSSSPLTPSSSRAAPWSRPGRGAPAIGGRHGGWPGSGTPTSSRPMGSPTTMGAGRAFRTVSDPKRVHAPHPGRRPRPGGLTEHASHSPAHPGMTPLLAGTGHAATSSSSPVTINTNLGSRPHVPSSPAPLAHAFTPPAMHRAPPRMTYAATRPAPSAEPTTIIQRSSGGAAAPAGSAAGAGGGKAPPGGDKPKHDASTDLNLMAQEVWSLLKRRMSFESDRQGRF